MNNLLAQSDVVSRAHRLIFVGGVWPVFWAIVAAAGLAASMWLIFVDGLIRRRFSLSLVLKVIACLWVAVIAGAMARARVNAGTAGLLVMALATAGMAIYLYTLERRFVPRSTGVILTGLRLALIVLLFAMMTEPVISLNRTESKRRCVAVLADESMSMDVVDRHMSGGERLRLADALGQLTEQARPIRLEGEAVDLRWIAAQLQPHGQWLTELLRGLQRQEAPSAGNDNARQSMADSVKRLLQRAERVAGKLTTVLEDRQTVPRECVPDLVDLRNRLSSQVVEPLGEILMGMDQEAVRQGPSADQVHRLIQMHEDVMRGLTAAAQSLEETGWRLDEAFARQADAETQRAMDQVGQLSRRQVAAGMLAGDRRGVLGRLGDEVKLRYYLFAAKARPLSGSDQLMAELKAPAAAGVPATTGPASPLSPVARSMPGPVASRPATADNGGPLRSATDLAEALEQVARDVPSDELSGIVILSDGQHNTPGDPVRVAQRFGSQKVGTYPVTIGARKPPTDAAIVKVDAPDVVYVDDTMDVGVSIRLDGLAGKALNVRLLDETRKVLELQDQDEQGHAIHRETPLREKSVAAATDHERVEVRLPHRPQGKGRHVYRVALDSVPEEVFKENNEQAFAVDVNDERTRVLLVDGLPRWEFRYLRNLLLRDASVRLQHVLFDPAVIARQPDIRPIVARATNEGPEADCLPEKAEDLNAYDVIVLGDVSPDDLARDRQQMIERFVSDRGGTLVVVAGKRFMPAAYEARLLAGLLPVQLAAHVQTASVEAGRSTDPAFRLRLTDEGLNHIVTELAVEPQTNQSLWDALPAMHWRGPVAPAKGGAAVLAWAEDTDRGAAGTSQPAGRRAGAERPLDPQRENAVLVAQNYGLGKVLYIGWDATWRFRYKHGDRYHHKFWAQVLRWATAGKLPSGLKLVKIGTDRARYSERQPVVVRAKFTRPDLTPMADAEVQAVIAQGEQVVSSVRLAYVPASPGLYEGTVSGLSRGQYNVRLDSPQIDSLRQREDPPGAVSTTIVVDPAQSAERLELAANPQLMARLAEVSDGAEIPMGAPDRLAEHVPIEPATKRICQQVTLWDKWWLLALFAGVIGAEWILRKRAGLM